VGDEAARQWVFDHIEPAKREAGVYDSGQEVDLKKDQRNSPYLFARLDARAIQALAVLNMEAAKIEAEKRSRAIVQIRPSSARFFRSGQTS